MRPISRDRQIQLEEHSASADATGHVHTNDRAADERWVPLPGWEDWYEVSDQGGVRSVARAVVTKKLRRRTGERITVRYRSRQIKPGVCRRTGHLSVQLRTCEHPAAVSRVAPLILLAFRGPQPPGTVAMHLNGRRADNSLANLRWDPILPAPMAATSTNETPEVAQTARRSRRAARTKNPLGSEE